MDLSCIYSRNLLLLIPYCLTKSSNGMKLFHFMIFSKHLTPLSFHVEKSRALLLIRKSGLFQMGVNLQGVIEDLVIFRNSHQAVRELLIQVLLKQLCFLIVGPMKGRLQIGIS